MHGVACVCVGVRCVSDGCGRLKTHSTWYFADCAVSHLGAAREAILSSKCLRHILGAMAEGAVVECTLPVDDAVTSLSMQLSTSDLAFAEGDASRESQAQMHLGPFSEGWYSSNGLAPPLLCARSDCLYVLFNVATLDFSTAMRGFQWSHLPARTLERTVRAVVEAVDDDSDCCDMQALMMMRMLEQLLQSAESFGVRLVRDAVDAIASVGTQVLHAISAECKMASMSGFNVPNGHDDAHSGDGDGSGRRAEAARQGRKRLRSSVGLFVLQAAVSALKQVCLSKCEAAVAALRSDTNITDVLVAVLSLFVRGYFSGQKSHCLA